MPYFSFELNDVSVTFGVKNASCRSLTLKLDGLSSDHILPRPGHS